MAVTKEEKAANLQDKERAPLPSTDSPELAACAARIGKRAAKTALTNSCKSAAEAAMDAAARHTSIVEIKDLTGRAGSKLNNLPHEMSQPAPPTGSHGAAMTIEQASGEAAKTTAVIVSSVTETLPAPTLNNRQALSGLVEG